MMVQLLYRIDFSYNNKIMTITLSPKFKVPQVELYDGSQDPIKDLENCKVQQYSMVTLRR